MMSCKQVTKLASQRHDRPLTHREKLGMKLHLLICKYCRRYTRQIDFLVRLGRHILPPPLSGEERHRLHEALAKKTATE